MRVLCDIDGVLADPAKEVVEYLHKNDRWDWDEYYKHTLELPPIPFMIAIVKQLLSDTANEVIFVTGRPESNRELTTTWLRNALGQNSFQLLMRKTGDWERPNWELKLEECLRLVPDLVIEDEPRAVVSLMNAGFKILQVHGYRITKQDYRPGENAK
jgi:hypothetical protein